MKISKFLAYPGYAIFTTLTEATTEHHTTEPETVTPFVTEVPIPTTPPGDECWEDGAGGYTGRVSTTDTGKTCQRWDSNSPHETHYQPQNPTHNYCRNPGTGRNNIS